ncbi:futalosine hydrolase [Flavobacteriales bacterium]|nr:futalosine hydrolase [Flavobacteriales bacterium]
MPKKILLVSATLAEMIKTQDSNFESLITGVGMVSTTFALTQKLTHNHFDLIIDLGIAGSFNPVFEIGSVVQVITDRFSELGVEDNGRFIPADEMKLAKKEDVVFETDIRTESLPEAHGITVNRVHGTRETIDSIRQQFNPDIESMEGAAVAYVCQKFNTPWIQIRSISNKVEPRNRDAWNISLAIENLHTEVSKYLEIVSK